MHVTMEGDSDDSRGAVDFNESEAELSDLDGLEFKDDHFVSVPGEERKRQPMLSEAIKRPPSRTLVESHEEPLQNCKKARNTFSKNLVKRRHYNSPEHWRGDHRSSDPQYQEGRSCALQSQAGEEECHRRSPNRQASPKPPRTQADSGSDSDDGPGGVRYFVPIGNKVGNSSRAADVHVHPPLLEMPSTSAPSNHNVILSEKLHMFQLEENDNNNDSNLYCPDLEMSSASALYSPLYCHDANPVGYSTQIDKIPREGDGNDNEPICHQPSVNVPSVDTFSSWRTKHKTDFMTIEPTQQKVSDNNDGSISCTPDVEMVPASGLSNQIVKPKTDPKDTHQTLLEENDSSTEGEKSTSSGSVDNTYRHHTTTETGHDSAAMIKKKPRCPLLAKRRTRKLVTCFGNLNKAVRINRPHVRPRRVQILKDSATYIVKMRKTLTEQKEMIEILQQQNQAYEAEIRKLEERKGVPEADRLDLRQFERALKTSKSPEVEQTPLEDAPARETPNSSDMSSNEAYQPTPETSELSSDGADSNR